MAVIKTHPNVAAFLDTLAFSEGTATHLLTRNNGYDVIVTGIDGKPEIFYRLSRSPVRRWAPGEGLQSSRGKSTASGRYQQLYLFWPHYQKQLALPDFSPVSQDRLAIQLIRERGALEDLQQGRIGARFPAVAISGLHCRVPDTVSVNTADKLVALWRKAGGGTA